MCRPRCQPDLNLGVTAEKEIVCKSHRHLKYSINSAVLLFPHARVCVCARARACACVCVVCVYVCIPPPPPRVCVIKVLFVENTELKGTLFKAWSRSVYSHTSYAYCQGFLPCLFLPFWSIHLHFPKTSSDFFPVLAVANTSSCVGPQNKIGYPVAFRFPC